uniref:Uncharacterized protein n=1 Tax=Vespula pensylvanica TaxID=30213 RepID=A0A834NS95_VESPE|nr:hypothetical protein H0235_011551 [Vespula pensylvanica]
MLFKLQHEDSNEEGEKTVGDTTFFHRSLRNIDFGAAVRCLAATGESCFYFLKVYEHTLPSLPTLPQAFIFLHGYGSIPWATSQLDHGHEDKTEKNFEDELSGENGQRQRDLRPCLSITASRYSSAYRRRPAGKGSNSPIYSQAMASEYKFSTAMWAQPD